ncbi:small ribosomal subunit biogenesis GTPase RsgA [Alteromonas sediminis]|uniref:Small ribosomal subunit biogenesis GTPase RsgA n=1 Tax=Alteromonas sediminis TaxID=2259342 RepID=A0A3N5XYR7_9ALTE|nr:small ribosomal subunit biogenesis GTPase RsgA [Alteromonas sediminis]RPJ66337.1 small ribosomal subunit biogenesis GTPase RsgA [Alteromonas sediminis]
MAKKPKLTRQQKRRVASNRQRRLDAAKADIDLISTQAGRVVGRFGKQADVEIQGELVRCHIRRTIDSVVCGDEVLVSQGGDSDDKVSGIIELVKDRRNLLSRPDYYDGVKPVAANIDYIVVVSAVLPEFSTHIIDRYLVACEDIGIAPLLVGNKIELADPNQVKQIESAMHVYQSLGYETLLTSCKDQQGIPDLSNKLKDKTSIFVGQSGVGKSSLINQILPNANELVGDISENSGLGQHTTTAAKLLHLPGGGDLIDSPGVREFGLWHLPAERVTNGFIEFKAYLGGCKFRDCKHKSDPGCLITDAVERGKIARSRYESYHRILDTMEEQKPSFI